MSSGYETVEFTKMTHQNQYGYSDTQTTNKPGYPTKLAHNEDPDHGEL